MAGSEILYTDGVMSRGDPSAKRGYACKESPQVEKVCLFPTGRGEGYDRVP